MKYVFILNLTNIFATEKFSSLSVSNILHKFFKPYTNFILMRCDKR